MTNRPNVKSFNYFSKMHLLQGFCKPILYHKHPITSWDIIICSKLQNKTRLVTASLLTKPPLLSSNRPNVKSFDYFSKCSLLKQFRKYFLKQKCPITSWDIIFHSKLQHKTKLVTVSLHTIQPQLLTNRPNVTLFECLFQMHFA